jgi:DNA repair exonuclease SbcCD ATPase subunit
MLQTIQIHNFQSHENSQLELTPGINTLVGDSDCGKSAVMRSILWAITNSPQGDAYVSDWTKTPKGKQMAGAATYVDIDTRPEKSGGPFRVVRKRTPDFNGYEVFDGSDSTQFEALRTDVPREVSQCFNIGPVNIQRQMDPPFLIASTPGEAARFINQLVNLTDIDEAQTEINSLGRSCSADLRAATASLEKAEVLVQGMEWVDRLQELAENLTGLEARMNEAQQKSRDLDEGLNRYRAAQATYEALSGLEMAQEALEKARRIGVDIGAASGKYNRLVASLKQYRALPDVESLSSMIEGADIVLDKARNLEGRIAAGGQQVRKLSKGLIEVRAAETLAGMDLDGAQIALNRASRLSRKIEEARTFVTARKNELERFGASSHIMDEASGVIEQTARELDGALCPVCGRPIKIHETVH